MDFILKQQAIFSSDMTELKTRMDQTTLNITQRLTSHEQEPHQ